MNIKRTLILLLLAGLVLIAQAACAAGMPSTVGTESGFMVSFTGESATRTHAIHLESGDSLTLSVVRGGGDIRVIIRPDGGAPLYDSNEVPEPGFAIAIAESGLYRLTAEGTDAVGSVWISRTLKSERQAEGMPMPREFRQSDLGYAIEYETSSFFVESTGEETQTDTMPTDVYTAIRQGTGAAQAMLIITRLSGDYSEQADTFALAMGTNGNGETEELPQTMIDGRSARHFYYESSDGKNIQETLFVEAGEGILLNITAVYSDDTKEIGKKMANMVQSMVFLY